MNIDVETITYSDLTMRASYEASLRIKEISDLNNQFILMSENKSLKAPDLEKFRSVIEEECALDLSEHYAVVPG